jgi:hypothetical protein
MEFYLVESLGKQKVESMVETLVVLLAEQLANYWAERMVSLMVDWKEIQTVEVLAVEKADKLVYC